MHDRGRSLRAITGAAFMVGLWAVSFLIPRAVRHQDALALACAIAFAAIALGLWLLVGVAVRAV